MKRIIYNILDGYHQLKIGQQLLVSYIVISMIPILVLQLFNYHKTRYTLTRQVDALVQDNLEQISEQINLNLQIYTSLLYQVYTDQDMIHNIENYMDGSEKQKAVTYSLISEKLRSYTSAQEGIRAISVICADGSAVIYDFATDSSINNLWNKFPDLRVIPPFQDAVGQPHMVVTPTMEFSENGNMRYYFHISKRMYDFDDLSRGSIATVVMSIDESILNDICNSSQNEQMRGTRMILTGDGKLIAFPISKYLCCSYSGKTDSETKDNLKNLAISSGLFPKGGVHIASYTDDGTGWTFYEMYNERNIVGELWNNLKIMLLVSGLLLILVTIFITIMVRRMNHEVDVVTAGMKTVSNGNLNVRIPEESRDEFGIIAGQFNVMTAKVQQLIHEVEEAKDRQKTAELRALEAQINPHFLYNTLDSINWIAIEHGEKEISNSLCDLGLILRQTICNSDGTSSVGREADLIRRYLELQNIRYADAFSYHITVAPEANDYQIHKLLVQPFVENAIVHGLEGVEENGLISVSFDISSDRSSLEISIADNGHGMSQEQIIKLMDKKQMTQKCCGRDHGYGLYNAFSRLCIYYGEQAHWDINSVKGIGTEFVLYIPVDKMEIDRQ